MAEHDRAARRALRLVQVCACGAVRRVELEHARNGSLGAVFDHVGIAVSDLVASERFYRTVLSVLGVEPTHADAELVEWDDFDIAPRENAKVGEKAFAEPRDGAMLTALGPFVRRGRTAFLRFDEARTEE